ncbi:esterase [Streptomyces sp. CB02366]|uniref:alpha/beta hydrolase n=2 Tax=Streptomyces TaxID=1883 RepID=UPI00093BF954|nr:alpha/beta hydrolase-fold protein [Streptomyces sp. CB02366]OKJ28022.1 esterase [Streptomyces sp. CB02366]TVP35681.1 esterase [Streptomyces griseus subsp. griseus]
MRMVTQTRWSEALEREKSVTVVLPPSYTSHGKPFPVLYLLHSYGGNRRSWLNCPTLTACVTGHRMILVLPESGRYWLINDVAGRRYEDYLVRDVVRQVDGEFNTVASSAGRAVAGFSMGGATAVFQALRHPDLFSVAGSHSGAFEAPLRVGDPYAAHRADRRLMMPTVKDHERVWGPVGSAVRRTYDPGRLLAERDPKALLRVYADVGLNDHERMILMNRRMRDALITHTVDHVYGERAGGHDWQFVDAGLHQLFGFVQDAVDGA